MLCTLTAHALRAVPAGASSGGELGDGGGLPASRPASCHPGVPSSHPQGHRGQPPAGKNSFGLCSAPYSTLQKALQAGCWSCRLALAGWQQARAPQAAPPSPREHALAILRGRRRDRCRGARAPARSAGELCRCASVPLCPPRHGAAAVLRVRYYTGAGVRDARHVLALSSFPQFASFRSHLTHPLLPPPSALLSAAPGRPS